MTIVVRVIDRERANAEAELKKLGQLLEANGYRETKGNYGYQVGPSKNWLMAREFSRE